MKGMLKIGCFFLTIIMLFSCAGCKDELDPPVRTPFVDESAYSDNDHICDS